jgi:voltage-gated potassium channel
MERRLEWPLLVAAMLTIRAIAIEQSGAGEPWDTAGAVLNWTIWLAFLGEAAVMLYLVDDRRRWLRDHPLDVARAAVVTVAGLHKCQP